MKGEILIFAIVDDQEEARFDAKKKLEKTFELPQMRDICQRKTSRRIEFGWGA